MPDPKILNIWSQRESKIVYHTCIFVFTLKLSSQPNNNMSGASVNVSYFRDLADNNSIVLNPERLDDTWSLYSQTSFSQGASTSELSIATITNIKSVLDVGTPSYGEIYPDWKSSRTSRSRESIRHSGIHKSNKKGTQKTIHNPVAKAPPSTSNYDISGHAHRTYHDPETGSLSDRERSAHDHFKYKGYMVKKSVWLLF